MPLAFSQAMKPQKLKGVGSPVGKMNEVIKTPKTDLNKADKFTTALKKKRNLF